MKKLIDLAAYFLILSVFYSCNSDVFVDDFRSSETEVALDGNGDVAVIRFASSNWDLLQIHTYYSTPCSCKVYDADGKLVATEQYPYLEGLGKIVCSDGLVDFTVERTNPKEVKITVDENARATHYRFNLMASNEYESQDISVDIAPSDRYVFDHITYSLNTYLFDDKTERGAGIYCPNGSNEVSFSFFMYPYDGICSSAIFKSDMPEVFQLFGEGNLTVEIPDLVGNNLVMNGKQAQYISTKQEWSFPSTERKEIVIPPYTNQRIVPVIDYGWFETAYTLYATHPKTGKQRIITGTLEGQVPVDYHIIRETLSNGNN